MARKAHHTPGQVVSLMSKVGGTLDSSELAAAMLAEFGGAGKLAQEFKIAYDGTKPGSVARTKMLESFLRIIQQASPKGGGEDMTAISTPDLEKVVAKIMTKMQAAEGQHATEESPAKQEQ